jgi:N-acetylmuramoyl-L-alanine amidase
MNETLLIGMDYLWRGESNYLWLLDFGHGGMRPDGTYTTAPAKMFRFKEFTICEGIINRAIGKIVVAGLKSLEIDYAMVSDPIEDTPLSIRVSRADAAYAKDKRCVYLSIHSNAGGGSGFEIFTYPGQSKSDKVANIFCEVYQKHFPKYPFRFDKSDGDYDKEAAYFVLRKTDCPALLVENLFFDNQKEAEYLISTAGQKAIAGCILDAIKTVEQLRPI